MRVKRFYKPIIFFCLFIIFIFLVFFTFDKIEGKKILVRNLYRHELVFSGEMTISEFGKVNQLESPLLKSVFGLNSDEDLKKKLSSVGLDQKEALKQINNTLLLRAKHESILITWFRGINKILLRNFGFVTKDIQRSGQPPRPIILWLHYELFPFKSVINVGWEPERFADQIYEKRFCEKRNIDFYHYAWTAGGPKDWREVDRVIEIIEKCRKPVWIHCRGGIDRTGGFVAIWKKGKGYPMDLIFKDFKTYRMPFYIWIQRLLCGNLSHVQN